MLFRIFSLTLLVIMTGSAFAEDDQIPTVSKDDFNFSWLDPDKKIYVVQNRKYTKAMRVEIDLSVGLGLGQAYRSTKTFMPRASFFLNEHWGASILGGYNNNQSNDNFAALKSVTSVIPTVRDVNSFTSLSLLWIPFYGKMNLFNQVFYVDWQFEGGVGTLSSNIDLNRSNTGAPKIDKSNFTAWHWGTGQKFFVTKNFSLRLDYLSQYYKAPTASLGVITAAEDTYNNTYITFGIGYTF